MRLINFLDITCVNILSQITFYNHYNPNSDHHYLHPNYLPISIKYLMGITRKLNKIPMYFYTIYYQYKFYSKLYVLSIHYTVSTRQIYCNYTFDIIVPVPCIMSRYMISHYVMHYVTIVTYLFIIQKKNQNKLSVFQYTITIYIFNTPNIYLQIIFLYYKSKIARHIKQWNILELVSQSYQWP